VIQHVLAEVANEQILIAVVVVIPDADALSPTRAADAGFLRHIDEGAVAIVLEEVRSGCGSFGETLKS